LVSSASTVAQVPKERAVFKGHDEAAFHLAFSPDGKLLASCGEPRVKVWDVATGKEVITLEAPEDVRWGRAVAFSPDSKTLAYMLDDGSIRLWDRTRGPESILLGETAGGVGGLAFLSNGRLLGFGSGAATLFDLQTREVLAEFTGAAGDFNAGALSPDESTLFAGGREGKLRLWDIRQKRVRAELAGHPRNVWAAAIAPDGKTAASGGDDGSIRIWNAETRALQTTLSGHRKRVTALAYTPDGKTLASTGADKTLRFWDTATRTERHAIVVPGETVRGVAFTRDGRIMATGNVDGVIRLWDMPAGNQEPAPGAPSREVLKGTIAHSPEDYLRIIGKVRVIDGNTIEFEGGQEVDISGGMDAPVLGQMGLRDGAFYPCGEEAAAFLRTLIGDSLVTSYVNTKHGLSDGGGRRLRGICLIGERRIDEAMVLSGWAVSSHSSLNAFEIIAREQNRGLWRGKFVAPKEWRNGARLPGEPPAPHAQPEPAAERPAAQPIAPTFVKDGDRVVKIVGTVEVLDAHTLRYADGTLVELNGGMDAPELEQQAALGDGLYPWGEQAAGFLRKRVEGHVVTCHVEGLRANRLRGSCYVDETELQVEMVRYGWAVSHHSGMDGWEMFASDNRRGIWRGRFVRPEDWRKGDRLPGEPGETNAQRQALSALHVFDPIVSLDESKPGRPVVAVQFRPNTLQKVGDDDLAQLAGFWNLRSLDLPSASKVTDAGLKHLAGLGRMVELNVNWTGVSAAGVIRLVKGRMMMERLEIAGVPFHDEDLAALRGVPDLRTLSLRRTLITNEGLAQLKRFEKLRTLSLMNTGVGDAGLEHLASLSALEDLDLDRTAITDAGLAHLKGLSNLRRLQVAHTAVTDAGLKHLENLPNLRELNVAGTNVTKEAADKLRRRIP
jgi:endonuclease YncB( thermonuclease family)